mmetsp:Transcript_10031/g.19265  ORF Transcript_10031/g.19265 Transcript_10031/m.19265 type:complete len:335 (-) Transcript_10031:72-1076(-)
MVGPVRNQMIELATGDIIVNMDNDDVYPAEYIHFMVTSLQNRGQAKHHVNQSQPRLAVMLRARTIEIDPGGTWRVSEVGPGSLIQGHSIAFHRNITCRFNYAPVTEENGFFKCAQARDAIINVFPNGKYTILKVTNPISITRQVFYMERSMWTPLLPDHWKGYYKSAMAMYLHLHNIFKPPCVLSAPLNETIDVGFMRYIDNKTDDSRRCEGPVYRSHECWKERISHPSPCEGFSRIPGATLAPRHPRKLVALAGHVQSVQACCYLCSNQTGCNGFDYEHLKAACSLAVVTPPHVPQKNQEGPLAYFKLDPRLSILHESGIRDSICPKCARKAV